MEAKEKKQKNVYLTTHNADKIERLADSLGITQTGALNYILNKIELPK